MPLEILNYKVEEYDDCGNLHETDKTFSINVNTMNTTYGRLDAQAILLSFLDKHYRGMNNTSGHYAQFNPGNPKTITIHWRKPIWKLSLVNETNKQTKETV